MAMTAPVGSYSWMRVVDVMTKDPLIVTPSETVAQAPYVRKDVAFGINIRRGEREGQASESATIGGV